jgi:hypothetical protein
MDECQSKLAGKKKQSPMPCIRIKKIFQRQFLSLRFGCIIVRPRKRKEIKTANFRKAQNINPAFKIGRGIILNIEQRGGESIVER